MDDLGYSPVSDDSDKLKEGRKRSRRSDETVENSNLFVNFIPPEYKEADLERMFSPFGTIISTKLMIDLRTHESKCFGFVKFATIDAARAAINALHDTKLTERRLVVKYAEPKGGSATPFGTPSCNIFIKNLPLSVTEDQISEELSKFGTISKCELYRGERGDSLGRATITYESQHAAAKAIDVLNDVPFPGDPNGERLKVRYEDTDHERETRLLKMKRRRMLSHKGGPPSPPHESFRGRRDDVRDDRGSHHRSSSEDSRHRYSSSHESRDRYSEHPSSQSRGYNDQDRFSDNRMPPRDSRWSAESSSYHSNDRDRERYEPHPSDRDRKRFAEPPPRDTHRDRFGPPQSTEREPTRFPEEDKRYMNEQPSRYYPDKDIRDFRDERSSFRGPPEIDNRPPFDRYGPPERDRFRPRDPETERFRGRDPEPLPPREERPREIIRDDRDRMMHRQDKDLDRGSYRDERDKRDFRDDRSRGIDGSRERAIARDRHAEDTQREINPDSNLFVYNLPSSYTDNDLYKLFREFGPIASVRVMTEPVSNQCKGFGFVEMATSEAASQAIQKMHGSKLYGKELQVSLKKDKPR